VSVIGKVKAGAELARLLGPRPPFLFTIGDSHSAVLRREEGVRVVHLGPVTLHRAGRSGELPRLIARSVAGPTLGAHSTRGASPIVRSMIRSRDTFLCFFGEIDVRAHFAQHRAEYGGAAGEARALAERGVAAAAELAATTGARGGFASITPPTDDHDERDFPTTATIADRREWTLMLNRELHAACCEHDLAFVDFHADYTDDEGNLDKMRADDSVHILPAYCNEVVDAVKSAGMMPS
jgi:hypothetical protein